MKDYRSLKISADLTIASDLAVYATWIDRRSDYAMCTNDVLTLDRFMAVSTSLDKEMATDILHSLQLYPSFISVIIYDECPVDFRDPSVTFKVTRAGLPALVRAGWPPVYLHLTPSIGVLVDAVCRLTGWEYDVVVHRVMHYIAFM